MTRQLHLNAFLHIDGHHEAAWREPDNDPVRSQHLDHYVALARTAERGLLDSVFLADNLALSDNLVYRSQSPFEPLTLLAALAVATQRIGLIATASTTYYEPFHVARLLNSLDHLSGGRIGWNIVTSAYHDEAENFGRDARPDHEVRYERAAEFLDVARALWASWDADAVVADKAAGHFLDPDRVHLIDHRGTHFRVRGPLTAPRSPQGRPVLVQAGASPTGIAFAARNAEVVFTATPTFEDGRTFYSAVKDSLAQFGREPDDVVVLPGLSPIVGRDEADALRRQADLDALIVPEYGLMQLSKILDVDMIGAPLDGPLPEIPTHTEGMQARAQLIVDLARREQLTIRELIVRLAAGRGHVVVAGSPTQIADEIERWFTDGAADGFNIMPPTLPGGLEDFVDLVVPELQRRKLFRTEYEGRTLRDNLGLTRTEAPR